MGWWRRCGWRWGSGRGGAAFGGAGYAHRQDAYAPGSAPRPRECRLRRVGYVHRQGCLCPGAPRRRARVSAASGGWIGSPMLRRKGAPRCRAVGWGLSRFVALGRVWGTDFFDENPYSAGILPLAEGALGSWADGARVAGAAAGGAVGEVSAAGARGADSVGLLSGRDGGAGDRSAKLCADGFSGADEDGGEPALG